MHEITDSPHHLNNINNININHTMEPSAPVLEDDLSPEIKFAQRPHRKEVYDRGILINDAKTDGSLEKSQQQLHKRRASTKLDNLLPSTPSCSDLEKRNIMLSEGDTIDTIREKCRRTSCIIIKSCKKTNAVELLI